MVPRDGAAAGAPGAGAGADPYGLGAAAGAAAVRPPPVAQAASVTIHHTAPWRTCARLRSVPRSHAVVFGPAEDGHHLAAFARDAQQLPAALAHVGAPADELLPLPGRGAKHPQVRDLLPLRRIRLGRQGHGEAGGRAISRVLFVPLAARWSSLWDGCRQPPRAAYPQLERPGPGLAACLALLRLGVAVPRLLPDARWALTAPFHPYP